MMTTTLPYRDYNPDTDLQPLLQIFREIGWLPEGNKNSEKAQALYLEAGRSLVADVNGTPECLVSNHDASLRYQNTDLPLCIIGGVATSRVARKQKLASRLTAQAIALDVIERGHTVAALGMFEQGYYDRLGFGTGPYVHFCRFDPTLLDIDVEPRVPIRLTDEDFEQVHQGRLNRLLPHGACSIHHPEVTHADMLTRSNRFALGYADPDTGQLTHHLCGCTGNVHSGPYDIKWLAYRTREEFLELLALLKSLGDQVTSVTIPEPSGVQMQDLIKTPFRRRSISMKGESETGVRAIAFWQLRICDLPAVLGKTHVPTSDAVTFNLSLRDPITKYLDDETKQKWPGVGGEYRVTLGKESHAELVGPDSGLPTLKTSVNTFTRLWLGVQRATGLAFTCPDLDAPESLLTQLDHVLCLPQPCVDWMF
ncbi:MAG: GNAT family N-acetyltransferase [Planctomycetes bacterium]|nr:GNAT family N-acetyltransferase [Planctomycetota bacterium]